MFVLHFGSLDHQKFNLKPIKVIRIHWNQKVHNSLIKHINALRVALNTFFAYKLLAITHEISIFA